MSGLVPINPVVFIGGVPVDSQYSFFAPLYKYNMKQLLDFIQEYFLILKTHAISPFKRPPAQWKVGSKNDVILLQGFGETWCFLEKIGNALNREGFKVHTIHKFAYNTLSIKDCMVILDEYFDFKNLSDVIFVSHSKGGLIAKYFIDNSRYGSKVKLSISIATPYQGTRFGNLRLYNLREISPNSDMIKALLANRTNTSRILNIHAKWDDHIGASVNAKLPEGRNIEIDIFGHARVLNSYETLDHILKCVN